MGNGNGTFRDCRDHLALTRRKVPFPKHYCRSSPTGPPASATSSVSCAKMANGYTSRRSAVFRHAENDRRSFRMFTAQLICQGACRQVDVMRAFGVSKSSVIRSVNTFRAGGVEAFYAPRATRGASVMTPEVTAQSPAVAGGWLEPNRSRRAAGPQARHAPQGDPARTTDRARPIQRGEATIDAAVSQPPAATDKSTRAVEDAVAEMGTACTRPDERVLAAFGFSTALRPALNPAATFPSAACFAPCRRWRRMACFDISMIA